MRKMREGGETKGKRETRVEGREGEGGGKKWEKTSDCNFKFSVLHDHNPLPFSLLPSLVLCCVGNVC